MTGDLFAADGDPQIGDVRFNDREEVEVFDGSGWSVYRGLPGDDAGTPLRNDPNDDQGVQQDDA